MCRGARSARYEVIADPATPGHRRAVVRRPRRRAAHGLGVHAVGRVDRDYLQYLLLMDREAHSPRTSARVVLPGGLHVRDVATVSWAAEERVRLIRGDGRPAALINISRQAGGSTLAVADSVAATMREPARARCRPACASRRSTTRPRWCARPSRRCATPCSSARSSPCSCCWSSCAHGRITAISALAIPLTLAITVFVMKLLGAHLQPDEPGRDGHRHRAGHRRRRRGHREHRAAPGAHTWTATRPIRDAVAELIWPVTTSTLTTVVVFLPLGLLQGVVGQFFAALSLTLAVAVLVSLVLALTIVPLLAEQFLHAEDRRTRALQGRAGETAGWARRRPGRQRSIG